MNGEQMKRFLERFKTAIESAESGDQGTELDDVCWDWLAEITKDHGQDGKRARALMAIAKEMVAG
jgi:hypothetical protein